jgi:hypothetical protein
MQGSNAGLSHAISNRRQNASLDSEQPKGQLTPIAVRVAFDKIRNRRGKLAHLQIAAPVRTLGNAIEGGDMKEI